MDMGIERVYVLLSRVNLAMVQVPGKTGWVRHPDAAIVMVLHGWWKLKEGFMNVPWGAV